MCCITPIHKAFYLSLNYFFFFSPAILATLAAYPPYQGIVKDGTAHRIQAHTPSRSPYSSDAYIPCTKQDLWGGEHYPRLYHGEHRSKVKAKQC